MSTTTPRGRASGPKAGGARRLTTAALIREKGIGDHHLAAPLHHVGGVPHPGEAGRGLGVAQIGPVVDHRGHRVVIVFHVPQAGAAQPPAKQIPGGLVLLQPGVEKAAVRVAVRERAAWPGRWRPRSFARRPRQRAGGSGTPRSGAARPRTKPGPGGGLWKRHASHAFSRQESTRQRAAPADLASNPAQPGRPRARRTKAWATK